MFAPHFEHEFPVDLLPCVKLCGLCCFETGSPSRYLPPAGSVKEDDLELPILLLPTPAAEISHVPPHPAVIYVLIVPHEGCEFKVSLTVILSAE